MAISLRKKKLYLKEIVYWFGVSEEKLTSGCKWNKMESKKFPELVFIRFQNDILRLWPLSFRT